MRTPQKPTRHVLSKSTFVRGCQCHKSLWMYKYQRENLDKQDEATAAFFSQGINAGELARNIFPGGVDATPKDVFHFQDSVMDTQNYIAAGEKIIYEAAFQYDGVLAAIDILINKRGKWYAYEVKASTSVKDAFIQDAALQYHVITNSGIQLQDIYIVHLNNDYVRNGDLELDKLFTKASVLVEVKQLQPFIKTKIAEFKGVLQLKKRPEIPVGKQCTSPYTCDFYNYCWKEVEGDGDYGEPITNANGIQEFLSQLQYPLYFMDFETIMTSIPEHDGHWPYRQVPFQYSVHIQHLKQDDVMHHEYISTPNSNPCKTFIENLIKVLGKKGSIIVYNKTFENTRLNELKEEFPEYQNEIELIQQRLVDLMVPFRKKHYYLPEMKGSYSIKYVLPALVPEYSYENLAIGNGGDASAAYYNLKFETNQETIDLVMANLFEYCKLDTLAMVKILKKLKEIV